MNNRIKQSVSAFLPMLVVFLIAQVAARYGLFGEYRWMSPLFHGIGGFATAWTICLVFAFGKKMFNWHISPSYLLFFCVLGMVVFIGVGWEVYELILDRYLGTTHLGDVYDTLEDLSMDVVGAVLFMSFFGGFFTHRVPLD